MKSPEYRSIVATIIRNVVRKKLPGVKLEHIKEIAKEASVAIHARMYGANVDNVDSPIWRDWDHPKANRNEHSTGGNQFMTVEITGNKPNVDASELLKQS
jgi:hypothetical protein